MASTQNGPVGMYKVNPYHSEETSLELPNCMYKVKPYHEEHLSSQQVKQGGGVDGMLAELERRQEAILARLGQLKAEVERLGGGALPSVTASSKTTAAAGQQDSLNGGLRDLVISVNPRSPPLSLLVLYHLLREQYRVLATCHTHSSVSNAGVADRQRAVFGTIDRDRRGYQLAFTLVWKDVKHGATLMVSPGSQLAIQGEANVARYLARLLTPAYDSADITTATEIDHYVDMATQLASGKDKEKASVIKTLNAKLGKSNTWVVGDNLSLADIVLWSAMHQGNQVTTASGNVKRWLDVCHQHVAFQSARNVL